MELWSHVTSQTKVSRLSFSENEWNREWIPRLFLTLNPDISKTKRDFSKITSKPGSEGQILSLEINLWKRCSWPLNLTSCLMFIKFTFYTSYSVNVELIIMSSLGREHKVLTGWWGQRILSCKPLSIVHYGYHSNPLLTFYYFKDVKRQIGTQTALESKWVR